jgi:hypothetical protein
MHSVAQLLLIHDDTVVAHDWAAVMLFWMHVSTGVTQPLAH